MRWIIIALHSPGRHLADDEIRASNLLGLTQNLARLNMTDLPIYQFWNRYKFPCIASIFYQRKIYQSELINFDEIISIQVSKLKKSLNFGILPYFVGRIWTKKHLLPTFCGYILTKLGFWSGINELENQHIYDNT